MTDSVCHCNSLGLLQMRWELPRLPFVELLIVLCSIQERRRKTSVFNLDQSWQWPVAAGTIFSSKNFGPADRNFQDQNSPHQQCTCVLRGRLSCSVAYPPAQFTFTPSSVWSSRKLWRMFAIQAEDAQCGLGFSKEANDDFVFVPCSALFLCLGVLLSLSAAHLRR